MYSPHTILSKAGRLSSDTSEPDRSEEAIKNINVEVKARVGDHGPIREALEHAGAEFRGGDSQIDTYYRVPRGRLKVRQGTIENCIVWYRRPDTRAPKTCDYHLVTFPRDSSTPAELASLLGSALDVAVQVKKDRDIYFLGNIKVHLDTVAGLGRFIEIEAIGTPGLSEADLARQCNELLARFEIPPDNLVDRSYLDLMVEARERSAPG